MAVRLGFLFVTARPTDPTTHADLVVQATRVAEAAAVRAGVRVNEVEQMPDLRAVSALLEDVWGRGFEGVPVNSELLRGIAHAGGAITVTRDAAGKLAGAAALVCSPGDSAYSLIAATRPGGGARGVGHAIKLHQRQWALEREIRTIRWTFDPLVGRNARFNPTKLRAVSSAYEELFYGTMSDSINGDDDSDRLVAVWQLDAPRTIEASEATPQGPRDPELSAASNLEVGPDGELMQARTGGVSWCRVPRDIVALRKADPRSATRWRAAVRGALTSSFAGGLVADGVSPGGWYRLTTQDDE